LTYLSTVLFDGGYAFVSFYVLYVQQDYLGNGSAHPEGGTYMQHANAKDDVFPSVSHGRTGTRQ
jgi:hypothetical protein